MHEYREEVSVISLLEETKKTNPSWNNIVSSLSDLFDEIRFIVAEDTYESYMFSGGNSKTYYYFNEQEMIDLVINEIKKVLESEK